MGISNMQFVRSLSRFLEVNPQVFRFNYYIFFLHATHCFALPCIAMHCHVGMFGSSDPNVESIACIGDLRIFRQFVASECGAKHVPNGVF